MSKEKLIERTTHAWHNMHDRCYNPKQRGYSSYGGKGVKVHHTWRKYYDEDGNRPAVLTHEMKQHDKLARLTFTCDVGRKPADSRYIHLGRKNDEGDYEPGNCKWEVDDEPFKPSVPSLERNRNLIADELDCPDIGHKVKNFGGLYGKGKVFRTIDFSVSFGFSNAIDCSILGKFLCRFNVNTGLQIAFIRRGAYHYKIVDWDMFQEAIVNITEVYMGELPSKIGTGVSDPTIYL